MKMDLMVVGIKAVTNEVMELELVPVISLKQQKDTLEIAMNGDISKLLSTIKEHEEHRNKIYVTREWMSNNNILPFQSMILNIQPAVGKKKDRIHKKISGE